MRIRKKAFGITAVAVAATLALTACSATGGKQKEAAAAGAIGGGAVADTERYTIAMVTHEAPGDSFWDKVRKGAETAAMKDNIELKYSADPTAAGESTLIQNAVDSQVDGGFYTQVYLGGPEPFIELEQLSPRFTAEDGATFAMVLSAERRPAAAK